jgi:hypothetical protein
MKLTAQIANITRNLMLLLPFALVAPVAAAAEVEAKKDTQIFKEATNKSDVVGNLKTGESVESVERKGMFWQIKTKGGETGFVSVLAVKHKAEVNGDLAKAIKNAVKQGRADEGDSDARQRSAVMGVRGLAADDDAGNAGKIRPNLRAVFALEDGSVKKKDIEALGADVLAEIEKKAGLD